MSGCHVSRSDTEPFRPGDVATVEVQLGRPPRGLRGVAHRCPCGLPDVVETAPRLAGGTPFPTLYYLTCPRACSGVGRLEASGLMAEMNERLANDPQLREAHENAHRDYLARRDSIEVLAGEPGVGGMPERVKCLHALVAHELAVPGSNPLGREVLERLPSWWNADGGSPCPCVSAPGEVGAGPPSADQVLDCRPLRVADPRRRTAAREEGS